AVSSAASRGTLFRPGAGRPPVNGTLGGGRGTAVFRSSDSRFRRSDRYDLRRVGVLMKFGPSDRIERGLIGTAAAHRYRFVASGREEIGVTHAGVDVDALPRLDGHRLVKLRVNHELALEDIKKLLSGVAYQPAEFLQGARPWASDDRHHALLAQIRTEKKVLVVARLDVNGVVHRSDAASGHRASL